MQKAEKFCFAGICIYWWE